MHPFLSPSLWEPPHPLSAPCSELCLEGPEISPSLGGRGKFPTPSCPLNRKTEPQFLNHRGRHLCLLPWQAHAAPSMTHPAAGRGYGADYIKYHNLLRLVPGTRLEGVRHQLTTQPQLPGTHIKLSEWSQGSLLSLGLHQRADFPKTTPQRETRRLSPAL